jgi:hypothetical protein
MTTIINGSSPSVTFSDGTTQTTAGLPLTGGTVTGNVTVTGNITQGANAAPTFSAYGTGGQSLPSATTTKLTINTEIFDTNNNFDSTTNYRFTPTIAGYYQVSGAITWATSATGYGLASIFKNGAEFKRGSSSPLISNLNVSQNVSTLIYLNGSTDYIELYAYQNSGTTVATFNNSPYVYFQACLMRAA